MRGMWIGTTVAVAATFAVAYALRHRRVPRVLAWFGTISYSVYLLHAILLLLFLKWMPAAYARPLPQRIAITVAFVTMVLVISWLSYRLVERPAQMLGRRVGRILDARFPPGTVQSRHSAPLRAWRGPRTAPSVAARVRPGARTVARRSTLDVWASEVRRGHERSTDHGDRGRVRHLRARPGRRQPDGHLVAGGQRLRRASRAEPRRTGPLGLRGGVAAARRPRLHLLRRRVRPRGRARRRGPRPGQRDTDQRSTPLRRPRAPGVQHPGVHQPARHRPLGQGR